MSTRGARVEQDAENVATKRDRVPSSGCSADAHEAAVLGLPVRSEAMSAVEEQICRIAASSAPALILGEPGTEKEQVARALHAHGPRCRGPIVTVGCSVIPAKLLESELFGRVQGEHGALIQAADHGTLFLDEIGDMSLPVQSRLMRFIEDRSTRRSSRATVRIPDARIVAATHRDLEFAVHAGTFREDLWHYLYATAIRIPPLRERRADIQPLALFFLRQTASASSRNKPQVSIIAQAIDLLVSYDWPGNAEQLRAVIERASTEAGGDVIDVRHLPSQVTTPSFSVLPSLLDVTWEDALDRCRREAGRHYLLALLKRYEGRVGDAAAHAGIEPASFYRLLRRHGVRTGSAAHR